MLFKGALYKLFAMLEAILKFNKNKREKRNKGETSMGNIIFHSNKMTAGISKCCLMPASEGNLT